MTHSTLPALIEAVCDVEANASAFATVAKTVELVGVVGHSRIPELYDGYVAGAQAVALPLKAALLEAIDLIENGVESVNWTHSKWITLEKIRAILEKAGRDE
jgi:hypothetical protein